MPPQYKFVEVSPVTAEGLDAAVNEWVAKGWQLECIRFVAIEHGRRPQLAFVSFVTSVACVAPLGEALGAGAPSGSVDAASPEPEPGPRPISSPEQPPRVITAPDGDEVE